MVRQLSESELRGIVSTADEVTVMAARYPIASLTNVLETLYLKPEAHIRLWRDPDFPCGRARHYAQVRRVFRVADQSEVDLIQVTILFNGNLRSKEGWEEAARAVAKELARIIFFSVAATRPERLASPEEQEQTAEAFAKGVIRHRAFVAARTRFTLPKLWEILRAHFPEHAGEFASPVEELLQSYLGPEARRDKGG